MRTSLLAAFSRVVLFWWLVYLVAWGWGQPENVETALARLSWLREVFGFEPIVQGDITVLNDVVALGVLLAGWTLPVLAATLLFIGVGVAFAHASVKTSLKERDARVARADSWRAVNVTKGPLPHPPAAKLPVPVEPLPLAIAPPAPYIDFLCEVLAHLKGATKAYAGGVSGAGTLYEQAVAELERGVRAKASPMVLCVLAARYLGNISAYAKGEGAGEWLKIKSPEIESSRRASMLAGWWAMTEAERTGLALALRYFDALDLLPTPGACPEAKEIAEQLILGGKAVGAAIAALDEAEALAKKALQEVAAATAQMSAAVTAATTTETSLSKGDSRGATQNARDAAPERDVKEAPASPPLAGAKVAELPVPQPVTVGATVPAEATPESIALQLLLDNMHTLRFQTPGLTKGVRAAGVKRGSRIFLFDGQIRASLLARASPEVRAMFPEDPERPKGQLFPFTKSLCRALQEKGWLIMKVGDMVVSRKTPLWRIRSGTAELAGVLIIDWPEDLKDRLPTGDTTFEIKVLGPQFDEREFIGSDVMGSLLSFNDSKE